MDLLAELLAWLQSAQSETPPETPEADDTVTVFTVAGTGQYNPLVGKANFPIMVTKLLNPEVFRVKAIRYPASIPFVYSVGDGVRSLRSAINATPGKIVLVGFSQGAMVVARVYAELLAGRLSARNGDLVTAVVFGNPFRKAGVGVPGHALDTHGIAAPELRMDVVDDRWWDFCLPGDVVGDVGDDLTGQWMTNLFQSLWGVSVRLGRGMQNIIWASPVDIRDAAQNLLGYIPLFSEAPHTQYETYVLSGGKTCVELAADHIEAAVAALP